MAFSRESRKPQNKRLAALTYPCFCPCCWAHNKRGTQKMICCRFCSISDLPKIIHPFGADSLSRFQHHLLDYLLVSLGCLGGRYAPSSEREIKQRVCFSEAQRPFRLGLKGQASSSGLHHDAAVGGFAKYDAPRKRHNVTIVQSSPNMVPGIQAKCHV